jgi:hypothetical protein
LLTRRLVGQERLDWQRTIFKKKLAVYFGSDKFLVFITTGFYRKVDTVGVLSGNGYYRIFCMSIRTFDVLNFTEDLVLDYIDK